MPLLNSLRKKVDHTTFYTDRFGGSFFVTLCCEKRGFNQLCHGDVSASVLETVGRYHQQETWWCELFLLMPDHCHALISLPRESSFSNTIRNFKRITTKVAGIGWQRGFFDHRLRHDESSKEKYDYIMANPVRAGLLAEGDVWPYFFTPR